LFLRVKARRCNPPIAIFFLEIWNLAQPSITFLFYLKNNFYEQTHVLVLENLFNSIKANSLEFHSEESIMIDKGLMCIGRKSLIYLHQTPTFFNRMYSLFSKSNEQMLCEISLLYIQKGTF
jgi:hypothetical protein